jgi:hypothetical protein
MLENSYAFYSTCGGNASLSTIEPVYWNGSIIDIYDFDGDATLQNAIVNKLIGKNFGDLYINDPPNSALG